MKYLIAQGLKNKTLLKRNGKLTNVKSGEGVKKIYNTEEPQTGGAVIQKPLRPIKPLKFKF